MIEVTASHKQIALAHKQIALAHVRQIDWNGFRSIERR